MPDSPSYQALVNAINRASAQTLPRPLTVDDCVFGDPRPYGGDAANTMISMGTNAPTVFGQEPTTIMYNRFTMQSFTAPSEPIDSTGAQNVSDLLSAINSAYGLSLTTADIVDQPIRRSDGRVSAYLMIAPSSLYYTGTIPLNLADSETPPENDPNLSQVVSNTALEGLTGPDE